MYIGKNESAKFWLSILNGLKNRGVEDILIACVNGLSGFTQAIEAIYPQTEIQQCIIHQIRNTTRFVSYKEIKPRMADLKKNGVGNIPKSPSPGVITGQIHPPILSI